MTFGWLSSRNRMVFAQIIAGSSVLRSDTAYENYGCNWEPAGSLCTIQLIQPSARACGADLTVCVGVRCLGRLESVELDLHLQGAPMPKRRVWTTAEVRVLRDLAGRKTVKAIGRTLKRSEASIRFKAFSKRIKLAMT
jgi:hypothetical protein